MLPTIAHQVLLKERLPRVKVLDVRENITALTTYSFTDVNLGFMSSSLTVGAEVEPYIPSVGRGAIVVVVHAEDDAVTFSVSSVTIGGVAGTEIVDRGGATVAVNTAIYVWPTNILEVAGLASTVAVNFSEAVTGCAIGVLAVDNINRAVMASGTSSQNSLSNATTVNGASSAAASRHMCAILGSTSLGGSDNASFEAVGVSGHTQPIILYNGSNANFSYAACYAVDYGINSPAVGNAYNIRTDWSGTTGFDIAAACFLG